MVYFEFMVHLEFAVSHRPDEQVAFFNQPMVELVSGIPAFVFTGIPDPFVFFGTTGLGFQVHLDRAFHIFAEFPAFVIDIAVH